MSSVGTNGYLMNFRQYFDEIINYLSFHWNEKSVAKTT